MGCGKSSGAGECLRLPQRDLEYITSAHLVVELETVDFAYPQLDAAIEIDQL